METALNDRFAVGKDVIVMATKAVGKIVKHEGGEGELRQTRVSFGSYEKVYDQYYLAPYRKIRSDALDTFCLGVDDLVESINNVCDRFNLPKVQYSDGRIFDSVYGLSLTPTVSYRHSISGFVEYCCWEMSISSTMSKDHGWDGTIHVFEEMNEVMTVVYNATKVYVAELAKIAVNHAVIKEFE